MKELKRINTILVIVLVITILVTKNVGAETHNTIYNIGMRITQLNYVQNIVTCETSTGFVFEFYGCEDYHTDDIIICVMDNNGTRQIMDDLIIDTIYSGFSLD